MFAYNIQIRYKVKYFQAFNIIKTYVVKTKVNGKKFGKTFLIIRMGNQTMSNIVVPKIIIEKEKRLICRRMGK